MKRLLFCRLGPVCYAISLRKERALRLLRDARRREPFAAEKGAPLPVAVYHHSSDMIKRAPGLDPALQTNKAHNIALASAALDGVLLRPGETFSFWRLVGDPSRKRGYRDGRVLRNDVLVAGVGGGLCNLANSVHLAALHSPLTVCEFHAHSDALAPDEGPRVPLSAGTSVSYPTLDLRFRNETALTFQLRAWCEGEQSHVELRCEEALPHRYAIEEEGHHFERADGRYYRVSKIYKLTRDAESGAVLEKKLVRDNRSEVMYDPSLIPPELFETPKGETP